MPCHAILVYALTQAEACGRRTLGVCPRWEVGAPPASNCEACGWGGGNSSAAQLLCVSPQCGIDDSEVAALAVGQVDPLVYDDRCARRTEPRNEARCEGVDAQ